MLPVHLLCLLDATWLWEAGRSNCCPPCMQVIKNTAAALGCLTELDWMQNSQCVLHSTLCPLLLSLKSKAAQPKRIAADVRRPYYPPVVNDAKLTQFVEDIGLRRAWICSCARRRSEEPEQA